MSIMISSSVSKDYLLTEDAVEGFKLAVENGQVRLALQVLTDVIDGMMEMFNMAFEEVEEEKEAEVKQEEKQPTAEKAVVEEKEVAVKKPAAKKEEAKTEAE